MVIRATMARDTGSEVKESESKPCMEVCIEKKVRPSSNVKSPKCAIQRSDVRELRGNRWKGSEGWRRYSNRKIDVRHVVSF